MKTRAPRATQRGGTLPRARELVSETATRRRVAEDASYRRALARVTEEIKEAHAKGAHEVTVLTVSPRVIARLRAAGYRVTLQRAAGMGDVDSHHIQW